MYSNASLKSIQNNIQFWIQHSPRLNHFIRSVSSVNRPLTEQDNLEVGTTLLIALEATSRHLDSYTHSTYTHCQGSPRLVCAIWVTFSPFGSNWNVLYLERKRYDPLNVSRGLQVLWYSLPIPNSYLSESLPLKPDDEAPTNVGLHAYWCFTR